MTGPGNSDDLFFRRVSRRRLLKGATAAGVASSSLWSGHVLVGAAPVGTPASKMLRPNRVGPGR